MRITFFIWIAITFVLTTNLHTQVPQEEAIRQEKLQKLEKLQQELAGKPIIDYGGWYYGEVTNLDDEPFEDERTFRVNDARFWLNISPQQRWRLYLRSYSYFIDFNKGQGYEKDKISYDLRLDVGFFDLDISDYQFLILPKPLHSSLRLGRQFFQAGRGLVYQNIADGVQITYLTKGLSAKLWAARSIRTHKDIDQSRPQPDRTERGFYSLEISYLGIPNQVLYALAMAQSDLNEEEPEIAGQDFEYNSQYFALGLNGSFLPRTRYLAEIIYQTGKSIATGTTEDERIRALGTTLFFELSPLKQPETLAIQLEYLYGSGDKDRISPTNTIGGNQPDTIDRSFVPFGYIHTGYALYPRLSNLHILKLGLTSVVAEKQYLSEELLLGLTGYYYLKDKKTGGISDVRASLGERYVGWGFDCYIRWRIFSDVSAGINYGRFFPGDAYPDQIGAVKLKARDIIIGFVNYVW